jgi:hypothetical protein
VTAAFKEWAVVIDALASGEQIFILRKGGIHEGRGGFKMQHSEFLLFPTLFHQQRESVIERAQRRFDEIAPSFPPPGVVRLEFWAAVIEAREIRSFEEVKRLQGQHSWKDNVIAERFEWGKKEGIFAIAVRVFRLPLGIELPMIPEYGGCKSWVDVAHPISTAGSTPVLEDEPFTSRLEAFRAALSNRVPTTLQELSMSQLPQ